MLIGVKIQEVTIGEGAIAEPGALITVCYTGYLNRGEVFQRNVLISFTVGDRHIIARAVTRRRGDERRRPVACGSARTSPAAIWRSAGTVPPNAKLTFDIELLAIG
jgi:FKBP-type peptidyl-prolyl cis-trans isomerase